jgi:hypothetical protein
MPEFQSGRRQSPFGYLRNSQAWADALESGRAAPHTTTQPPARTVQRFDSFPAIAPGPGDAGLDGLDSITPSSVSGNLNPPHNTNTPSVADLLSRLRASQNLDPASNAIEGDRMPERSFPPLGQANTAPHLRPKALPPMPPSPRRTSGPSHFNRPCPMYLVSGGSARRRGLQ